jgi:CRP/FNR family transcriptional regulator
MTKNSAAVEYLHQLSPESRIALEAISTQVNYRRREYIFQANLTNNTVYVLLEGRIKLSRLSDQGQESIQWFCFPGEFFGFSEYTYCHDSGLYAQALSNAKLLVIAKQDFNRLVLKTPALALLIIDQLSSRVRTLGDMLLHIACGSAQDRLINLLQRLSEIYGEPSDEQVNISMYLTHQEIADMIGVCRQTVSSLMAEMKKNGIISSNRHGIVIHSLARLNTALKEQSPPATSAN